MRKKNDPVGLRFLMKDPPPSHQLRTVENKNPSILQQWITYSFAINKSFPLEFLLPYIQGLGGLDAKIRQWEEIWEAKNIDDLSAPKEATVQAIMDFSYWYFLSYLWVLSAYEIIRTLEEKGKKRKKGNAKQIFNKEITRRIEETKNILAEARIPLAKLKPKGNGRTAIAVPVIFPGEGFGWRISSDESEPAEEISRRELADAVLDLLKLMHENDFVAEDTTKK